VNELTDFAHDNQMLAIACVNPTSLAILKSPGSFGEKGVDIVCGEGQPLGVPLASGGPYFGFLTSKSAYVRQMPGRIVGQTLDKEGNIGYSLTLQAREQHIRRAKATSNICTNQGLLVTAATIYMAMIGAEGLANVAKACWQNTQKLIQKLVSIPGVQQQFKGPGFHETVLTLPKLASEVLSALAQYHINGGLDVSAYYPELKGALLVCATELTTDADIDLYYQALSECLS
jgi:glycine dehydrogenase subunit 1